MDKVIQEAIAEHKKGNFEEAERLYREVLQAQPTHPYVNHNLGSLAVSSFNSVDALPFFKTALELDPKVEEFWISYINALILANETQKAKQIIKKADDAGFHGEKFNNLSLRLLSPIQIQDKGDFFEAQDGKYLEFLKVLHKKRYEIYFEIGSRSGHSLSLSQSPSIAIDPYYQLECNPVGKKDFCLLFQETSDNFFKNTLPKFPYFKCELGFIDGMHLFEYALRDFINLTKISSKRALFMIHDALPWSYEMTTRDYKTLPQGAAWTGDIWKLIPILIEIGMKDSMKLLTLGPSGLLAILNPKKEIIAKLEKNLDDICSKWLNKKLDNNELSNLYQSKIFIKPDKYLQFLKNENFGKKPVSISKKWVSH
tara:strand:+ start:5944 stop:7050 length:1107 start_codon:yes stop_codon:yes gene_type:complete